MVSEEIHTRRGDSYLFQLNLDRAFWSFGLRDDPAPVLISCQPLPLVPDIIGASLDFASVRVEASDSSNINGGRLVLSAQLRGAVEGQVINELCFLPDRLICRSEYQADRPHSLAHWQVAPSGSGLHADKAHAYIGSSDLLTNGQVFTTNQLALSTASHNWLYSPMSPRLLIGRGSFWIGIGGTTLAHDFGLELKTDRERVHHFHFNYGGTEAAMGIASTGMQIGPRLQLNVTSNQSPDQSHAVFTQSMISDGLLTPRRHWPEERHWRNAWVCTWGDQMKMAGDNIAEAEKCLSHDLVLKIARRIRQHRLPVGTFIIDAGWEDEWGDWNLETRRIPDMRELVDALHEMGFKVILWWAPFLVSPRARVSKSREMLNPHAQHDQLVLDYSQGATREYIQAKLDRFFSSEPGGWNLDGVKVDFIAEKIYPNPNGGDSEWHGEERVMHHLFRMIDETITRYKEGPGILGEAYNPFLNPYCIAFQLEERFDRQLGYIDDRPAMAEALIPGAWLSPHFTYHADLISEYLRRSRQIESIPQIGMILDKQTSPEIINEMRHRLLNDQPGTGSMVCDAV